MYEVYPMAQYFNEEKFEEIYLGMCKGENSCLAMIPVEDFLEFPDDYQESLYAYLSFAQIECGQNP
jgi:hypothetical protein